ncbi:hypothetical protein [Pseudorhodoferax sp. Leaf265]|uniref:hypothetical protein n=1 Tax=Pseudorhodoferax sp. Leaf265 TaxID=1736315 RepID=UPI000B1BA3B9|nr:hypothetical protein [Pseudorhodoferax sp. Leaf265]
MATIALHYGTGQAYTTWQDLRAAAVAINLAGTDQQGEIILHESITIANNTLDWLGLGIDLNHYWRIKPAPGLGWRDAGLAYSKPAAGIKITANAGASNGFKASNGFVLDGLILEGTNTTAAKPQFDIGRTSGTDSDVAGVENCWMDLGNGACYPLIVRRSPKTTGAVPTVFARRNVIVVSGGTQPALVTQGNPLVERNTIRVPTPAAVNGLRLIIGANNHGGWCRDNAIDGSILEEHSGAFSVETAASTASVNNHYSGVFTKTGTGAGYNLAGWINDLTSAAFDGAGYRPADGGVLIGAASATAENTPDINGNNSGLDPDVGAIQRNAAAPLATGSITGVTTSGQQVSVSGTQSLAVSGSASLTGTTSGGTVPLTIGSGVFSAEFADVPPGTYSCQVLLYNSEGAVTSITGGAVVISDITGSPEGPAVEDAIPPQMQGTISLSGLTHNSYTTGVDAATDNVAVTGYRVSQDGGSTWIDKGASRTHNHTGRTPGATDQVRWSARDEAGNWATPLSRAVTLAAAPDTTAPVMTGSIAVSAKTHNSYTLTWPAASDAVGVTGYEYSLNGGTSYIDASAILTINVTGRTPSATDQVRVRAYDAAGNKATPLSASVTLDAAPDTQAPVMTGAIASSLVTQTSYTIDWPAATDNVAVAGYEFSVNAGSTYTDNGTTRTRAVTGRTPSSTDQVRVRAYDAAGNRATPLSLSVSLLAGGGVLPPGPGGTIAGFSPATFFQMLAMAGES